MLTRPHVYSDPDSRPAIQPDPEPFHEVTNERHLVRLLVAPKRPVISESRTDTPLPGVVVERRGEPAPGGGV